MESGEEGTDAEIEQMRKSQRERQTIDSGDERDEESEITPSSCCNQLFSSESKQHSTFGQQQK